MILSRLFCLIVFMLSLGLFGLSGSISCAWADSNQNNTTESSTVSVSSEGERAVIENTPYAADEFSEQTKVLTALLIRCIEDIPTFNHMKIWPHW